MKAVKYCEAGGREKNEDAAAFAINGDAGVFAVADGLGGHGNGATASACVTETIIKEFGKQDTCSTENLMRLFTRAQQELLYLQNREPETNGMRTTAVVLLICAGQAVWGHIGDSRLYYIHKGKLSPVTADHSVAYQSYISGEISYADIPKSPDQSKLIRSMGNPNKFMPELASVIPIKKGDAFLLCSDGFWEYVSPEEILWAYKKTSSVVQWTAKMVKLLLANGKESPQRDNCSAVAVII